MPFLRVEGRAAPSEPDTPTPLMTVIPDLYGYAAVDGYYVRQPRLLATYRDLGVLSAGLVLQESAAGAVVIVSSDRKTFP